MKSTLFVVRLRSCYRRVPDYASYTVIGSGAQPCAAFSRREDAEQYCCSVVPIEVNPFLRKDYFYTKRDDETDFLFWNQYHMDWSAFVAELESLGWAPPDEEWNPEVWGPWWELKTARMNLEEKKRLSSRLHLPNWGEYPLTRICWYGDEAEYQVDQTMVIRRLEREGIPVPDDCETEPGWIHWWNSTPLTDEQKTTLWRLLDPQPYEIVEVELSPIIGGGEERAGGNTKGDGGNRT